jgi:hypothetical protein
MKWLVTPSLLLLFLLAAACGNTAGSESRTADDDKGASTPGIAAAQAALDDWILGTDFGICQGSIDESTKTVTIRFDADGFAALTHQDELDIEAAVYDLLAVTLAYPADLGKYRIQYDVAGRIIGGSGMSPLEAGEQVLFRSAAGSVVNLVFIHHSCGENWLNDGLCLALNDNGYHVADIYYGWREYGDSTDTVDWPDWFTDEVMCLVFQEMDAMTASNALDAAPGENSVIMFKSCYPNSDVGSDISDEKTIYDSLLPYFERHPEKMFVLVTPPPMREISAPAKTRELCNWLTERETGWLAGLSTRNVFVFDFYNVLTDPAAHHRLVGGEEVHEIVGGRDTLYYDSDGDDHPNSEGNRKATEEFVPLLNKWYQGFVATRG